MLVHRRAQSKALVALVTGAIAVAFGIVAAPPAHAYADSNLCVVNHTAGTVRVKFFKKGSRTWIQDWRDERSIAQGGQECKKDSRTDGPDIGALLEVDKRSNARNPYTFLGEFWVNNPAVGWPVIVERLSGSPSCSWDTYASTCWHARLGQRQHRCLQQKGYWMRPSREADSGGAKQFRIQVYDGSADPSSFGC